MRFVVLIGLAAALIPPTLPAAAIAHEGDHTPFSVIGLPDTQNYSELYPDIFYAQTNWVVEVLEPRNIRFVSHFGDLVQHGDRPAEWAVADMAMSVLDAHDVPYGVCPGNHDVTPTGTVGEPYIPQNYLDYFGPQRFNGRDWFGGASASGMSTYQHFAGGGLDFLAVHVHVDSPVEELVWAQGVIERHPHMPVMVTTHRYMQDAPDFTGDVPVVPAGRYPDIWYTFEDTYSPNGIHSEELFQNFIRTNRQIFLINCGHFHAEHRQTSTNLHDIPVHEVLADYQDDPNGGNGWLRIMEFDVQNDVINVETYSPTLDQFRTGGESRFTLSVDFDAHRYADPTLFFHDGINGYARTLDTWINEDAQGSSYGGSGILEIDDDVTNNPLPFTSDLQAQSMIRFQDVFSPTGEPGRVPSGEQILSARLRFAIDDDIDNPLANPRVFVHQMIRGWDESSTWSSMGGGLDAGVDYGAFLGSVPGDNNPDGDYWRGVDVTPAVQAWSDGAPNHGFALTLEIISGNDDGVSVRSSETGNALLRPMLQVTYAATPACPGDFNNSGDTDVTDLLAFLAVWFDGNPGADTDKNGTVDVLDLLLFLGDWFTAC